MADSITGGGIVTFDVKVNGEAIPGSCPVHAIRIETAINRIGTATLSILDGDPASESFAISASPLFVPGNPISIEAGYDGTSVVVFQGIVTQQSLRIDNASGPMLEVQCKHQAVKLTVGRKSANYSQSTDSDAMSQLISSAGLKADVASTSNTLPTLIQYYASDWDFVLSRAEVNGLLVSTLDDKVKVFDPVATTTSVLSLTYGKNILGFDGALNAVGQLAQVQASAWSFQSQQLISATASNDLPGPGNLSSKTLAAVAGPATYALQTAATETDAELMAWAKAQMLKSELSKITGRVRCQGTSAVLPGGYISLSGLGARFDGDHFVSGVEHVIADGNWVTDIAFGLSPGWFSQNHDVQAPPAAGLLSGIQGLFNGKVLKLCDDPDGEYRIQVEVALFNDNATGLWARMANFYSTNGQGAFFLPEVGDEVILGFLNQDPRFPIILGSLYSQKNVPFNAFSPNQENSMKGIVSKSALRMMFDDQQKILSLVTPASNTVVLDDKNGQVNIKDSNGNSIVMSSSGIEIKSQGNISLQAAQKITLKGDTGIQLTSSAGDATTSAVNIQQTAQMEFAAKANMVAQVQSGVQLTLKGAMVMIN